MGLTKSIGYEVNEKQLAVFAKALGHPARVAILQLLLKRETCICGDIVDEINLSQSTVSQHLKELRAAGIIKGTIDGSRVCYCIDLEVWQLARASFDDLFASLVPQNNCDPESDCC
jgi:DNA-binding transcriptional ArsR family regulator